MVTSRTAAKTSSVGYLIIDESQRPNVTFRCVPFPLEVLWGHVQWGAYQCFVHVILGEHVFSKTEVRELKDFVGDEDVLRFDITVNHTVPDKLQKPCADLFEQQYGYFLLELPIPLKPRP